MPSWTVNTIEFDSEETCDKARELMQSSRSGFDFEKIKPMPSELNVEAGGRTNQAIVYYLTDGGKNADVDISDKYFDELMSSSVKSELAQAKRVVKSDPEMDEKFRQLGEIYVSNVDNYGSPHWYDWCNKNWGCKWNASDVTWDDTSVEFYTPWDPPIPVLEELSRKLDKPFSFAFDQEGEGVYMTSVTPTDGFIRDCKYMSADEYYNVAEYEVDSETARELVKNEMYNDGDESMSYER